MLKFKIKKEINLYELSFLFEDKIKNTPLINEQNYYNKLYNFIKEYHIDENIQNIKDVINKKYVILLQNEDNKLNFNQEFFTHYVFVKKYTSNIFNANNAPEISIGNISFEKITFCPSLYWKYLYIKETLNIIKNKIHPYNIYNIWDNTLLTIKIKNPEDYIILTNYVNFYKKLEIKYDYAFNNIDKFNIDSFFSFLKLPFLTSLKSNINYISYINTSILDHKLKLISIKNEHFINIINKTFPSDIIKNFTHNYDLFNNFEKALPKEYYNKLLFLYQQETDFNKAFLENKCEHYKLVKTNKIKEILELFLDKKNSTSFDANVLTSQHSYFQCTKCNFNLICPHTIFKFLYKEKNLNSFIDYFENKDNIAFCKICGEKLYETSFGIDTPVKSDLQLTFEGINEPEDILKKNIYIEVLAIIKNLITKNKYIYNNDIHTFVYNHIYDSLFNVINIIHKDKTTSNYIKSIKFNILIYIYCISSVAIIATTQSQLIKIFNTKTSQLKNLIPLIIEHISEYKKVIINKLGFSKNNIENLVIEILNKLKDNLPKFTSLKHVSINAFILNDINENIFYNYVFIINKILYDKNFDIEIVLNINTNDIILNKNNIFLPNYNILKTKTGGLLTKEMKPVFSAKNISNISKKLIKDFTNDKITNEYLNTNQYFIELKKNIDLIEIDSLKKIYSIINISYLQNFNYMYKILYNKPNYEVNNIINTKISLDYLNNIKYNAFITEDNNIKTNKNTIVLSKKNTQIFSKINYNYKNSEIICKIIKDLNLIKYNDKTDDIPLYLKKIIYPQINIEDITSNYDIDFILEKINNIQQLKDYYKYIKEYIDLNIDLFTPVKDLLPLFKIISVTSSEEGLFSKSSLKDRPIEDDENVNIDMDVSNNMGDEWDPEDDTNLQNRN